jgi:hypothetical protein
MKKINDSHSSSLTVSPKPETHLMYASFSAQSSGEKAQRCTCPDGVVSTAHRYASKTVCWYAHRVAHDMREEEMKDELLMDL